MFCIIRTDIDAVEQIQCANDGRTGIKLSYDEIHELCVNTTSSYPVECYKMVSNKDRQKYGMKLCKGAQNSLTWKCWKGKNNLIAFNIYCWVDNLEIGFSDITGIKGVSNRIDDQVALDFCTTINDAGPVNCVRHSLSAQFPSISATQIIDACQYAVEVLPPHDESAPLHCMNELKPSISPSRGVVAADIIQFCSASVSRAATECFQYASYNASSKTAGNSTLRGTVPSSLLALCWDARSATGPVDCLEMANEYRDKSGIPVPGAPADWPLQLCSAAPNTGPAQCFAQTDFVRKEKTADGKSLSNKLVSDIRMGMCYGAINTGPAMCLRRSISAFFKSIAPAPKLLEQMGGAIEVPEGLDPSLHYASLLCAGMDLKWYHFCCHSSILLNFRGTIRCPRRLCRTSTSVACSRRSNSPLLR